MKFGHSRRRRPAIRRGELEIDLLNRTVRAGEHALHLTALELSLLSLLAANDGRVLTRDEILDHLWGVDFVAESNVVDRHVRSLRATLQATGAGPAPSPPSPAAAPASCRSPRTGGVPPRGSPAAPPG